MAKIILKFDMMHHRQSKKLSIRKATVLKVTLGGLGE